MSFNYSQVFLLIWIIAFWIGYSLTYGKVEMKHERSTREKYKVTSRWGPFFGLTFLLYTIVILVYVFYYDSVNWIWKISLLDNDPVQIAAMAIMCFAFSLNILFTLSAAKSIKAGVEEGEKPKLVTTGIYRYIRHPGYLALCLAVLGTFLIIPNVLILIFLLYTIVVIYGHTLEEERNLTEVYGKEYERYKDKVGRFFPRIVNRSQT